MNLNAILSQIFSIHLCLYVTLFCLLLEVNCDQEANEWKLYKELGGTPMDLLNKLDDKRGINLGRKMMCRMDPRNCAGLLSDSSPYQRNVVYRRAEGFLHSDDSQRDSLSRATESRLPIFSDRRY